MKTLTTLLSIFSLFYFASSCKKGDTSNAVPHYDSTHYKDSVKHVTDSIKHATDSIYKSPYGVYYGYTATSFHMAGCIIHNSFVDSFYVIELTGDSILICTARNSGPYGDKFPGNAQGHYYISSGTKVYEATVGNGNLVVYRREDYGSGEYDDARFKGSKKK